MNFYQSICINEFDIVENLYGGGYTSYTLHKNQQYMTISSRL